MDRAHAPLGPLLTRPVRRSRRAPKVDLELEAGARAHFEDPLYYADSYEWRKDDVRYYREVGKAYDRVLEQGVGNGRIALPLAREGTAVTGIDHSAAMLAHFRELLQDEPRDVRRRITLFKGDIRKKRIKKRFPIVFCPFNAALHLYTRPDVEAWLARVREHLEPGGELVFDISMPIPKDLARDPNVAYRVAPFEHPTAGRVRYKEHFDYDRVRQIQFVSMFFEPEPKKGPKRTKGEAFMTPLAQRQFFPQEMEALLFYNGFDVTELYGDFERGPLVGSSDVMVWHARPRRSR